MSVEVLTNLYRPITPVTRIIVLDLREFLFIKRFWIILKGGIVEFLAIDERPVKGPFIDLIRLVCLLYWLIDDCQLRH